MGFRTDSLGHVLTLLFLQNFHFQDAETRGKVTYFTETLHHLKNLLSHFPQYGGSLRRLLLDLETDDE